MSTGEFGIFLANGGGGGGSKCGFGCWLPRRGEERLTIVAEGARDTECRLDRLVAVYRDRRCCLGRGGCGSAMAVE